LPKQGWAQMVDIPSDESCFAVQRAIADPVVGTVQVAGRKLRRRHLLNRSLSRSS
jgi:hypothetical protein